jgi:hypothetical protein
MALFRLVVATAVASVGLWAMQTAPASAGAVSETWGAKTPKGYGGLSATDVGCSATALSLTSQVDNNGNPVSFWTADSNGNIVLAGTYGATPPTLSAPYYTLTVSGTGCSQTVTTTIVASRADVRFLSSTDNSTSFQMQALLASSTAVAAGDTVMCRDSIAKNVSSGTPWTIRPPSNAWGGRVSVTSENQASGTDPQNGQAAEGGGCEIGPLQLVNPGSSSDGDWPIDFSYLHFYVDCNPAGTPCDVGNLGNYTHLFNGSPGFDWTLTHSLFEVGPDIVNVTDIGGIYFNYRGCYGHTPCPDGLTTYNMTPKVMDFSNDRFNGTSYGGKAINTTLTGMTNMPAVPLKAYWVVCNGVVSTDCLDIMPTPQTDIEYLFVYNQLAMGGSHIDSDQTFPTSRTPSSGGSAYNAGTYKYNIVVRGTNNSQCCQAGVQGDVVAVTTAGSGYAATTGSVSGTVTGVNATGGTCVGVPLDVTVDSTGAISGAIISTGAEQAGWGCAGGDVLTLTRENSATWFHTAGSGATFTVCDLSVPGCTTNNATNNAGDSQGAPFQNQTGTDTFSSMTATNNIYVGGHSNGATTNAVTGGVTMTNNTVVFDITTLSNPQHPGVTIAKINQNNNTGAGGDLSRNFSNKILPAFGTTAPTCYPVTCSTSGTGVALITSNQANYSAAMPNWAGTGYTNLLAWTSRANAIANMTPSNTAFVAAGTAGGVVLADGSVMGALWPKDYLGQVCWAAGSTAFNYNTDCTTVSTLAQ